MKGERLSIKNPEEIGVRLRSEKDKKVRIKLIFLNFMANFRVDLEKACQVFSIATPTAYVWVKQWNQEGYEGIKGQRRKTTEAL